MTLKISRTSLKVFTDLSLDEVSTSSVHCHLKSSSNTSLAIGWHNIFAAIQLSFGDVIISDSRNDDNFNIDVLKDKRGWKGDAPLLISFYAPSWTILLEAKDTVVAFEVEITSQSIMTFTKAFGFELNVYKTNVRNEDNVFITRNRFNQKEYSSICSFVNFGGAEDEFSSEFARLIIRANFDAKTGQIRTMTGRLDIIADDAKSTLKDGCSVETFHVSPCVIAVVLEKEKQQHLHFPAPVRQAGLKCRIARKSSYVEVEALLSHPVDDDGLSHFISPTYINGQDPTVWNMPYLDLDRLPKIDTAKTKDLPWLNTHTSLMWSPRERESREKSMFSGMDQKDVRINFKDSLHSQFGRYTRVPGQQAKVFGINSPKNGGIQLIIFVSCLRLDLSNRTVVLDAAVLPLTDQLVPTIVTFLRAITSAGMCSITADEEETTLWKKMLPAFVERCRRWKHRPTCEYLKRSQIPLSLKTGEMMICSCGNGTVPKGLISGIPHWNTISKHVVRAAISPIFTPPFVEPALEISDLKLEKGGMDKSNSCAACGKKESPRDGTKLQKCARCQKAKYCSVGCQRADWPKHKKWCGK